MSSFLSHVLTDISENLFLSVGQNIATFTIFYKYLKEANIQNIIRKHKEDEKECRSKNHLRQRKWKKGFDNILSVCKQFTRAYTVEIFLGSFCISFYLLCFLYHKHEQIA